MRFHVRLQFIVAIDQFVALLPFAGEIDFGLFRIRWHWMLCETWIWRLNWFFVRFVTLKLTWAASFKRSKHNSSSSADASDSRSSMGCDWIFPFSRFCCVSHSLQRSSFSRPILFVAIFTVDFFFIGDFVVLRTLFRVRTILKMQHYHLAPWQAQTKHKWHLGAL